jgi:crotonobetainyl-CoA:carnitine CoA-transferase CaiB-like acyl-CoA transferase
MIRPLGGLRVVDLADERGEMCGRMLADLGAEVLRVEPPGGAVSRQLPPFAADERTSLFFGLRNLGKRGAVLDLGSEADREHLHALLAEADVLLESFAPGTLAGWGLDPDALRARHPHLVVTSMTGFGQSGPYRDFEWTDLVGFAMGGMMHRCGAPSRPPVVMPGALASDNLGVTAAFATLMALWQRIDTHTGQHVDVSAFEALAALSDWSIPSHSINPVAGTRAGAGIYSLYRCADGWVRMIVLVKHHWKALLEWMGHPEELADPALEEFVPRLIRHAEIEKVIERFFADRKMIEVAEEAQARGLAATPLLRPGEVLENAHTKARGSFRDVDVADGVRVRMPAGLLTHEGERVHGGDRVPRLGEHGQGAFSDDRAAGASLWPIAAPSQRASRKPFDGIRVLDFGVGAVGVEIGRFLAEYGADVIKVESRGAPDFIRTIMGTEMNPSFASSSRSKRSFGVNLKTERGLALVHELARSADVVIENNAAGVMERIGLGYEKLAELNPRIVMFSSQIVGSFGPWSGWIGYGPSTHPVSGLQWLWNYPEDVDAPAGSTNVYPDHFVGRIGAFAVTAGLLQREKSGRGLHLDAAQFESAMEMIGDLLAQESESPGSVRPLGNASRRGAPWGCYPCAGDDEWCVVCVRSDEEWQALRRAMGDPAWARSEAFVSEAGRRAAQGEVEAGLAAWTCARSPHDVMQALQQAGVPAGVVTHGGHLNADPHLKERGFLAIVEQPDLGTVTFEGEAFHGSGWDPARIGHAPRLGEHTREIAVERLRLDEAEIDALVAEGVLELSVDG